MLYLTCPENKRLLWWNIEVLRTIWKLKKKNQKENHLVWFESQIEFDMSVKGDVL